MTNGSAAGQSYLYELRSRGQAPVSPGFNFNQFSLSLPELERYGGYFRGEHKFVGDQLVVYGDAMYQNVQTHNELAAPATGSFQTAGQVTLAIPPRCAEPRRHRRRSDGPTYAETGVLGRRLQSFQSVSIKSSPAERARVWLNSAIACSTTKPTPFSPPSGFKGDKLFDGNWGYDAGFRYSQIKNIQTGTQVSISRFNRILNQADPIFDPNFVRIHWHDQGVQSFRRLSAFRFASNAATVAYATVHPEG